MADKDDANTCEIENDGYKSNEHESGDQTNAIWLDVNVVVCALFEFAQICWTLIRPTGILVDIEHMQETLEVLTNDARSTYIRVQFVYNNPWTVAADGFGFVICHTISPHNFLRVFNYPLRHRVHLFVLDLHAVYKS